MASFYLSKDGSHLLFLRADDLLLQEAVPDASAQLVTRGMLDVHYISGDGTILRYSTLEQDMTLYEYRDGQQEVLASGLQSIVFADGARCAYIRYNPNNACVRSLYLLDNQGEHLISDGLVGELRFTRDDLFLFEACPTKTLGDPTYLICAGPEGTLWQFDTAELDNEQVYCTDDRSLFLLNGGVLRCFHPQDGYQAGALLAQEVYDLYVPPEADCAYYLADGGGRVDLYRTDGEKQTLIAADTGGEAGIYLDGAALCRTGDPSPIYYTPAGEEYPFDQAFSAVHPSPDPWAYSYRRREFYRLTGDQLLVYYDRTLALWDKDACQICADQADWFYTPVPLGKAISVPLQANLGTLEWGEAQE